MSLRLPGDVVQATATSACPTCGGQGTWHPGRQAVVCPSCGNTIVVPPSTPDRDTSFEFLPLLRDRPNSGRDWQPGATEVRCSVCHAAMQYPAYLAGRSCEACGSPALVPCDETGAPVHPSGVLPFSLTDGDGRSSFTEWVVRQSVLGIRRSRFSIDAVRADYIPCWAFSARVRCPWRGEVTRTNRDGETKTTAIAGVVDAEFDSLLVPASRSIPPDLVESIEPFPMADLAAYDSRYLAGYGVEVYAVNLWDAWDAASERMRLDLDAQLRADSKTSPSTLETWPEWTGERCQHVLVPVYVIDYRYGTDAYVAVVNGRTGKVAGRAPRSVVVEILAGTLLLTVVAGLVYAAVRAVRWLL